MKLQVWAAKRLYCQLFGWWNRLFCI